MGVVDVHGEGFPRKEDSDWNAEEGQGGCGLNVFHVGRSVLLQLSKVLWYVKSHDITLHYD